jgi:hypothetical protein
MLHDIDKSHYQRTSPKPNSVDRLNQRMAHGTFGVTLETEATDPNTPRVIFKDGRLLVQVNGETFIDVSNGNLEVQRTGSDDIYTRLGYRPDDGGNAVEVAKPGQTL